MTELGNTDKDMSVEALVGCYLFENEFSAENWNAFYRYNILCVQKYLNTGLILTLDVDTYVGTCSGRCFPLYGAQDSCR